MNKQTPGLKAQIRSLRDKIAGVQEQIDQLDANPDEYAEIFRGAYLNIRARYQHQLAQLVDRIGRE